MSATCVPLLTFASTCSEAGLDPKLKLAQLAKDKRRRLVEALTAYPIPFTGHEGFPKV